MKLKVTIGEHNRPSVWVHGEIGHNVTSADVRETLTEIPDEQPITVRIDSPGGSFRDSISIHSMLTRRKGDVHVVVDSEASSGGSVVAMAGKTITMHTGSWMMIHEPAGSVNGARAAQMRDYATQLEAITDQLVQIYKKRWNGSEAELRAALNAETWLRDSEAVAMGMADSVDGALAVAACADHSKFGYRNVPDAILQAQHQLRATIEANKAAYERLQIYTPKESA